MSEQKYVALTHLRFGDDLIAPGQFVPFEKGRRYDLLEMSGQVGKAHEVAGDTAESEAMKAELEAYRSAVGTLLPGDYPGQAALFKAGFYSEAAVAALSDDQLHAVKGVGQSTFEQIRAKTPHKE